MTPASDTPRVAFAKGDDIASVLGRIARTDPTRTALISGDARVSYGALDAQVARVATALVALGIPPGGRVAILAQNSVQYVEIFFGALRAGAAVVPLPTLSSAEALRAMVDDSDASLLFATAAYLDVARSATQGRTMVRVALDFTAEGWVPYDGLPASSAPAAPVVLDGDAPFDVIYSSGTTGVPKGIVHSHGARKASYAGARAAYFSRESVNVVSTPFYSNTTCITWLLTTAAGGTNVLLGKFSADAFLDATERHAATHAMLVPTQYDRIFCSERFRAETVSSLRYVFSTSSPLRAETKRRILDEFRAELVEIYELTEGGPVTVLEARRHDSKLASVGLPSQGCDIRIVDESGRDVPSGQAGEIVGRSANMMSGYLNRPEETAELQFRAEDGNLYFRSGDIGRFDSDGFLYLLDRKKDVIISGGFNVFATDLEVAFATHPAVAEIAVIGVPSARWGETPLALIVPRPNSAVTEAELLEYGNARVGKAQRATAVEFRAELPRNAIGKILKRELREPYWKR